MGHDEPYFAGDVAYVFRLPIAMRQPENAFYAPMAMLGTPSAIFRLPTAAPLPTAPPKSYPPRQSPPHRATRRCQTKPTRARGDCRAACRCAAPRRFPAIARTNACCLKRECCRFAIAPSRLAFFACAAGNRQRAVAEAVVVDDELQILRGEGFGQGGLASGEQQ